MSKLFLYEFSAHAKLLLTVMTLGLSIYILADVLERTDLFMEAGTGFSRTAQYFLLKIPGILSQILPAVFFLATVIQLALMVKAREFIALQAGGISPFTILGQFLIIACFWAVIQLSFSQQVGVWGDEKAREIWQLQVKKVETLDKPIFNVWFTEGTWVISLNSLQKSGVGTKLTAYNLTPTGTEITEIVRADTFTATTEGWILEKGLRIQPSAFLQEPFETYTLPIKKNHTLLFLTGENAKPQQLPLQHLSNAIRELQDTGSNVEALQTAWHIKIAYAFSLLVLTLVAFALITWKESMYLCVSLSILISFLFYVFIMLGETLGQQGIVAPVVAAYTPHLLFTFLACLRLFITFKQ